VHAYDVPRRHALQPVPSARAAQDPGGPSATPIYDALYDEYVTSFRTLPGDRSGEEKLGFTAFSDIPHGSGTFSSSYGAYSVGAQSTRYTSGHQPYHARTDHSQTHHSQQPRQSRESPQSQPAPQSAQSPWQRVGRIAQPQPHHVPAALPPSPRRGT
jgi:hypothetical protein